MAKDPAFLFYPGDWHLGTMHMTILEKGAYLELLMLQFSLGKFTLAHAKHMLNGSFDIVWNNIQNKFVNDGEYYWNERLKLEKEKRAMFSESRRTNAKSIKEHKAYVKAHAEHMYKHMENENENENKDINKDKGGMGEKEKPPKIKYSQFVSMTEVEFLKLVELHGNEFTNQCIEALDNYKGSSGKKYQNDYRAILSWVVDKIKQKNHGKTNGFNINSKNITTTTTIGGVKMGKL